MVINRLTEADRQEHMHIGKCFLCHQIRHCAQECPQKKKGPPSVRKVEEDEETRCVQEDFELKNYIDDSIPRKTCTFDMSYW